MFKSHFVAIIIRCESDSQPVLCDFQISFFSIVKISLNIIIITCTCDLYPLAPNFYIVKLGCTGVYIIFLFLLLNINCRYRLEPPH